jgi:hypothetical protein
MLGTTTLANLYLGSDLGNAAIEEDTLEITLSDGRTIVVPLEFISELSQQPLSPEAQLLILRHPPQINHVHVTANALNVYLEDGRMLSSPLSWFPRLLHGTETERNRYQLLGDNDVIHWPDLDEDIDLSRLFVGGKSQESEGSIQRWLATRRQPAIREDSPDYGG